MHTRESLCRSLLALLLVACVAGCSKSTAPKSSPNDATSLSVSLSLQAALDNRLAVDRVSLTATNGSFSSTISMTPAAGAVTGSIAPAPAGHYRIHLAIYDGASLIATGSGEIDADAGTNSAVTADVTYATDRLEVTNVRSTGGANVPRLLSPDVAAVLDNGCPSASDPIVWEFDWSDVLGATEYQLYVKNTQSLYPAVDVSQLTSSSYRDECGGCYIVDHNRQG